MKPLTKTLASLSVLAIAASSFAWIDTGHMAIAAIAEGRLTKKAWDECDRLARIGADDKTKGFVQASVWADDTKTSENGPWHYINIPFRPDGRPAKVKPAEENVVWAINRFSEVLKDKSKPDAQRADALRYLIHFVGDIHQPLHSVAMESDAFPNGDRGGNEVKIKTGEIFSMMERPPDNLHFLWDMGAGIFMPGLEHRPLAPDAEGRIRILGQNLTIRYPLSSFKEQVKDLDPMNWAKESRRTAEDIVYRLRTGNEIDLSYVAIAKTIAGQRAALAGYRLAALLNKLVG
jgi:hypothetical protein